MDFLFNHSHLTTSVVGLKQNKMTKQDSEFVLMCAVDYVINRHTYAPNMLVRIISQQWSELSENTQKYIYTAVKRNYFDCDTSWHKILGL